MQPLLKVEGLIKDFGTLRALDGVSFAIPEKGSVVGLLGPNGAGKTTCIDILLGSTIPEAGSVEYFGQDFFRQQAGGVEAGQLCLRVSQPAVPHDGA